jgi:heat shock protein HslJ
MRNIQILIVFFITALLSLSCVSPETTVTAKSNKRVPVTPAQMSELQDIEWYLEKMSKDKEPIALVPDSKVTFMMKNAGKVAGLATLNRYFGSLVLSEKGDIIWQGPLGMTKMAGPPELMKQEDIFIDVLPKCQRMYRQGSRLILEDNKQSIILVFARQQP